MALTPGIERMHTFAFPGLSLLAIQYAITIPCLGSGIGAIVAAILIRKGVLSKRNATLIGLFLYGFSGVLAFLFHAEMWQVYIDGCVMGLGLGFFQSNITTIMIDNFDDHERKLASGMQGAFISFGGILMSFSAGLLVTVVWYGGYLILAVSIPIMFVAAFTLPKDKRMHAATAAKLRDLPKDVYYYAAIASMLFVMTFAALANNLSSHFDASGIENYSVAAGSAIALNMLGGCILGFFFRKLSTKFGDYLVTIGFVILGIGYFMVSYFSDSLIMMMVGAFVCGTTVTMVTPQGIMSMSRELDNTNSFYGTMIYSCIANGLAGFLVSPIYTGITQLIKPNDTEFRYYFVAACSITIGILFALNTIRRQRKGIVYK
jgi:MFS family permease